MSQDITQFEWYQILNGKVSPDILHLKNSSNNYLWNDVHILNIKYLTKNVVSFPWINHFALAVLSTTDRKLNAMSINNMISSLHARFRDVFEAYELNTVQELRDRHIIGLINSEICITLTDRQRSNFISHYKTFYYNISKWIREKLTEEELQNISLYVLPEFAFDHNDFKVRQQAIDKAHKKRKDQTSAIAPLLPSIRAESHFRWNQIKRLREITIKMIKKVESGLETLPLNFSYTESEFLNEKLYFTLHRNMGLKKLNRTEEEIVDTSHYYIEFIKAESLIDNSEGEGLWFFEIIQNRFLGAWSTLCSPERKKEGELFFESRGYDLLETLHPFQSRNKGVLTQGFQLTRQNNLLDTSNFLINIEPIFIACMFGMFAIDVQCSSGARLNELLQISYDKECCIITEDKSIVPTKKSYIFRLIPKGRIIEENYYMPENIFKSLAFIIEELRKHYGSKHLPTVSYSVNARKELIKDRKFVFQYEGSHINNFTINAIIRFLTHGLSIETQEGKPVILTTHLLRHAFATHAAQTEKLPIDIIRRVLHQRDESVTEYYSAPTGQQVSSLLDTMHENWASYIDIQKEVVRGPEELQEIYQEYKENVGTVSKVVGGVCTIDSVCPTKMACMGCAAKVPQPEFKHEIQNVYDWAEESEKRFRGLGLEVEVRKMKIIKKRAKIELKEIHLIEQFEKDEYYEPNIEVD